MGRERVSKIAGGVTTYFYWGIGEKVNGSWTRLYVQGLGGKLVEYSDGGTKFFVTNHLGTIAARMDLSGETMEIYRYLPYGERYAGNQTPHQYTGKERDSESGLDYFGARYYGSAHGRWMSVDAVLGDVHNPQRHNRYAYCLGEPINHLDPDGADPLDAYRFWLWIQSYLGLVNHATITVVGDLSDVWGPGTISSNSGFHMAAAVGGGADQHMLRDTDPASGIVSPITVRQLRSLELDGSKIADYLTNLENNSACVGQIVGLLSVGAALLGSGGAEAMAIAGGMTALSQALIMYGHGEASRTDIGLAAANLKASGQLLPMALGEAVRIGLSSGGAKLIGFGAGGLIQGIFGAAGGQGSPDILSQGFDSIMSQSDNSLQSLIGLVGIGIGKVLPSYGNQILSDCGFSAEP